MVVAAVVLAAVLVLSSKHRLANLHLVPRRYTRTPFRLGRVVGRLLRPHAAQVKARQVEFPVSLHIIAAGAPAGCPVVPEVRKLLSIMAICAASKRLRAVLAHVRTGWIAGAVWAAARAPFSLEVAQTSSSLVKGWEASVEASGRRQVERYDRSGTTAGLREKV